MASRGPTRALPTASLDEKQHGNANTIHHTAVMTKGTHRFCCVSQPERRRLQRHEYVQGEQQATAEIAHGIAEAVRSTATDFGR